MPSARGGYPFTEYVYFVFYLQDAMGASFALEAGAEAWIAGAADDEDERENFWIDSCTKAEHEAWVGS